MEKRKAIIYGIGKLYSEVKTKIYEVYDVVAKVDKNVSKQEAIISLDEAIAFFYDVIVISIENIETCFEVISILIEKYAIPSYKIELGMNLKIDKEDEYLEVSSDGGIVQKKGDLLVKSKNIDEFVNVRDILKNRCYDFWSGRGQKIVIDIGMNVGGASLYFAKSNDVMKVYGFEPFPETFAQAEGNFELNPSIRERIEAYPYGISDTDEIRRIIYNKNMTCGQSTDAKANLKARRNYKDWELISKEDDMEVEVEVKDIKNILLKIYQIHKQEDMILKIDCEGEEYRIIERINECTLFGRIKVIMMEWHYDGNERILEILRENQYMYCNFREGNNGLIYAFKES